MNELLEDALIFICVVCERPTMHECQNCSAVVTAAYARVFTPPEMDGVRVCPYCSDKVRENGKVRAARSGRRN